MKNLFIIPTDKPSRLSKQLDNPLVLYKQFIENRKFGKWSINQNIYITNDEKIKEGDWFYLDMSHSNTLPDEIHQMGNDKWSKTGGIHFCEGNTWVDSCKKIILTTDQDLIKDGVQAIDDEFLEWFVNNSSCESFEVVEQELNTDYRSDWKQKFYYKIIIPKKESNLFELQKTLPDDVFYESLEPKQETLEEASLLSRPIHLIWDEDERYDCNEEFREEFKKGAKWKQERSYSEEEVFNLLMEFSSRNINSSSGTPHSIAKWFGQFKKK